jgi:hypothetical protein
MVWEDAPFRVVAAADAILGALLPTLLQWFGCDSAERRAAVVLHRCNR